jgi:hypothetical protein
VAIDEQLLEIPFAGGNFRDVSLPDAVLAALESSGPRTNGSLNVYRPSAITTWMGSGILAINRNCRMRSRAPPSVASGPLVRSVFGWAKRPDHASLPFGET